MEEEIEWEVQILWGNMLVGPSRMRTEHLWEWMREHIEQEATAEAEMRTDLEER